MFSLATGPLSVSPAFYFSIPALHPESQTTTNSVPLFGEENSSEKLTALNVMETFANE